MCIWWQTFNPLKGRAKLCLFTHRWYNNDMKYINFKEHYSIHDRFKGRFKNTDDIAWDVYEIEQEGKSGLKDGSIFADFNKIYAMSYLVKKEHIEQIQSDPEKRIKLGPTSPENRPSFDSKTGNIHLATDKEFRVRQLLLVHDIPGAHYGVKIDNSIARQNPEIKYNVFTKGNNEYYTPKACYYPPIDDTNFETTEEKQIQEMLKKLYGEIQNEQC